MHLSTHLHDHFNQIIQRFRVHDGEDPSLAEKLLKGLKAQKAKHHESKAQSLRWEAPEERTTSPKTVHSDEFRRKEAKRFWRRRKDSEAANTAWNGLSIDERSRYAALAKQNEVYNTAKFAKFNSRIPLAPSVEELKFTITMGPPNPLSLGFQTRRISLQNWNRYRFDHPRACGGAVTPVPGTPFPFMKLPVELRREIYVHVLHRRLRAVCQLRPDGSADVVGGPIDVRIFAVSRTVFAEAVRVFYETNTFALTPRDRRYRTHIPLFVSQSTRDQVPRPTDSIKSMQVDLGMEYAESPPYVQVDGGQEHWEQVCDFLKDCKNLRKIEIAVWCKDYIYDSAGPGVDQKIDKLFEMFREIRSADEAVYSETTSTHPGVAFVSLYRTRRITGIIDPPRNDRTPRITDIIDPPGNKSYAADHRHHDPSQQRQDPFGMLERALRLI